MTTSKNFGTWIPYFSFLWQLLLCRSDFTTYALLPEAFFFNCCAPHVLQHFQIGSPQLVILPHRISGLMMQKTTGMQHHPWYRTIFSWGGGGDRGRGISFYYFHLSKPHSNDHLLLKGTPKQRHKLAWKYRQHATTSTCSLPMAVLSLIIQQKLFWWWCFFFGGLQILAP